MIQTVQITREFRYQDLVLPDPSETLSAEAVKDFYASQYPALTNAQINDLGIENDKHVYSFAGKVGTKG